MNPTKLCLLTLLCIGSCSVAKSQYCSDPIDTIYGLSSLSGSSSGQILAMSVNDGGAATIGSPATNSANANGLGYSTATNKFYFFNRVGAGDSTVFVSFDPATGTQTSLAIPSSPALPTSSSGKIRSGTVNNTGDGYYTIFPGAKISYGYPTTGPAFYYYDIPTDTWTLITQTFKDISGNVVSELQSLNSGDMAFDGAGNLWIVCAKSTTYALFRVDAPVPTSPVASITVDTVVAPTASPAGVSITGIAFNSAGTLYLGSGSGGGAGNNQLYKLTKPTAPLVNIGTYTNGYGDDFTSCIYPLTVLPISYFQFAGRFINNSVRLTWKTGEANNVTGYNIEYSNDETNWSKIGYVFKSNSNTAYNYSDYKYQTGNNYYRIAQVSSGGQEKYSSVQKIVINSNDQLRIKVNLVHNSLEVYGKYTPEKYSAAIFDNTGRLVLPRMAVNAGESIDVSKLTRGMYLVQFSVPSESKNIGTYKFIKY